MVTIRQVYNPSMVAETTTKSPYVPWLPVDMGTRSEWRSGKIIELGDKRYKIESRRIYMYLQWKNNGTIIRLNGNRMGIISDTINLVNHYSLGSPILKKNNIGFLPRTSRSCKSRCEMAADIWSWVSGKYG